MGATLQRLLGEIRALNAQERERLRELLADQSRPQHAPKTLDELAVEQGVNPVNFDELRTLGEFWPTEENVDDFVAAVRNWRREGTGRSLDS